MSPIVISSINTANLPVKYSLLSNYAQRYLKSQVKSISFALNHFFSENNLIEMKYLKTDEAKDTSDNDVVCAMQCLLRTIRKSRDYLLSKG